MTVTVRIEPLGVALSVGDAETVMRAALRAGLRWPNVCGGNGECRVCRLEILDRHAPDPPLTRAEETAAANGSLTGLGGAVVRLACQLVPPADMTVRKAGVRRPTTTGVTTP
ncbi:MAG TPA: 2Fe-2S iron-sulfur cluster binding domain-containing protein [Acidimicrobiia bacterium]|nr:2Fe-2S iron-sulfur cluster binding domain-containing protein [Acidimicrobiia bacterium]